MFTDALSGVKQLMINWERNTSFSWVIIWIHMDTKESRPRVHIKCFMRFWTLRKGILMTLPCCWGTMICII